MEVDSVRSEIVEECEDRSRAEDNEESCSGRRDSLDAIELYELLKSGEDIRIRRRGGKKVKHRDGIRTRTGNVSSLKESPPWGLLALAVVYIVVIRLLIVYSHDMLIEAEKLSWTRT
eukprot:278948-Prorocentrum_minimum.AAC.2